MYWEFFICRNLLCGFLVIEVLVLVLCSVAQNHKQKHTKRISFGHFNEIKLHVKLSIYAWSCTIVIILSILSFDINVSLGIFCVQGSWHFFFSNFMELRRDLTYIMGIMNGDIEIDSQLLGTSQNTPVSDSNSPPPPPPQVENASSTKCHK